ncbi:MAG: translation initiation factor IF-3 [Candidatus Levybacteria bacterium RIFCSPLOWO2_01_FULL_39_10]|nr:MAG: translation initiation factor IF-3 [Candidatus Levybacteria bacterium RIFCSPLOWO2_01_FULL_39_10]
MRKRFNKNNKFGRYYRTNNRIFAQELRVLDESGKQIGVISKNEALNIAREANLDLVEIAPAARPPVARIIDFNKFLYQEEKKKREQRKKSKTGDTKEVRLGPFMNAHDLETMTKRTREFLEDNSKVKLVVRFKGREMGHPEFGYKVIKKAIESLSDISKVDREPKFEGRQLIAMISPDKKTKNGKEIQEKN